jgi:hypothetical protein
MGGKAQLFGREVARICKTTTAITFRENNYIFMRPIPCIKASFMENQQIHFLILYVIY